MPHSPATDAIDHPHCPNCTGQGMAHAVTIKDGLRTVSYECNKCQHKWDITVAEPRT